MPNFFKLKFCLPKRFGKVHVKVRELEYEHFYRMTNPDISSNKGCGNFFQWPTATVIRKLKGLKMFNLGVLVRLDEQRPNVKEKVAPVIFYHGKSPNNISGYSFTFKTKKDARLKYSIRNEHTKRKVLMEKDFSLKKGNKPFQINWDNAPTKSGFYKLILKGYFVRNNEHIRQSVRFYHQPSIH